MSDLAKSRTTLLRCDATVEGGVGHFVRCAALARAANTRGWDVQITGTITAPLAVELARDFNHVLHPAPRSTSELVDLTAKIGAAVVHVDHYDGLNNVRDRLATVALASTATDGSFGRREADVIVDGSPRSLEVFDTLYESADLAIGPEYLALRTGLRTESRDVSRSQPSILVMMGGTDAAGYGPAIAAAVRRLTPALTVGLVGGSVAGVEQVEPDPDIAGLLADWDVVVTAAGTTVWELAALGIPMAVVAITENQLDHYDWLTANGLAVGIGRIPDRNAIPVENLGALLNEPTFRIEAAARGQSVVDGQGSERIVALWERALADISTQALRIRRAEMRDAGRLFAWRNEVGTRAASRNSDPVQWPDHLKWLGRSLHQDDRRLYLGHENGIAVGSTRFDNVLPGEWEVSITVAPSARGQGTGTKLVAEGIEDLRQHVAQLSKVHAVLRTTNRASRALFERLGFRKGHVVDSWETWTLSA